MHYNNVKELGAQTKDEKKQLNYFLCEGLQQVPGLLF